MFAADVSLFPDSASTVANRVDALFFFMITVCGFFAVLIALLVIYFAVRYRRRSEDERPPKYHAPGALEVFWSVVPLGLSMVMYVWGASLYFTMRRPPADADEIYVVGRQWMWKIQHLGGQREINELHIPRGRPIRLRMISEDVIHGFFVPAFRTKMDVLPGRYTIQWFEATKNGTYHIFCTQYCGTGHSRMVGRVVVMEPAEFQKWLDSRAEGSLALQGRKLFFKLRCITCHSADARARAPVLESLFGRPVSLKDGSTVIADEDYLRESILKPEAKVVSGFDPIMPTFQGQISESELLQVIAYIRSLEPGQTPTRTERTPSPVVSPQAGKEGGKH